MRNQCLLTACATFGMLFAVSPPASAQVSFEASAQSAPVFDLAAGPNVAATKTASVAATTDNPASASMVSVIAAAEQSSRQAAALQMSKLRSEAHKWELAYLTLSAIDAAQTIDCLSRDVCAEANPLFGKNPSAKTIIAAKLGASLAHYALFTYLNKRHPKSAKLGAQVSVALQGAVVMLNARAAF